MKDFFELLEKCGCVEKSDDRDADSISTDGELT